MDGKPEDTTAGVPAAPAPSPSPPPAASATPVILSVRAIKLFDIINLRDLRKVFPEERIQPAPQGFVITFGEKSYLFLFRFGCVAFFNFTEEAMAAELGRLKEAIGAPVTEPPTEHYELRTGDAALVEFEYVQTKRLTRDHIALTCLTVAHSVALDYLERNTESLLDSSTSLFTRVSSQGRLPFDLRSIVKIIGSTANTRQDVISKLAILDAPDETWKSKELDSLYRDVRDNFEIDIRFRALDRKLTLVQDNLELLADMTSYQRANFLELLIIILILIEILLGLSGLLTH